MHRQKDPQGVSQPACVGINKGKGWREKGEAGEHKKKGENDGKGKDGMCIYCIY